MSHSGLVALLPMRGGSERVPNKNLRGLAGAPLYSYILQTLTGLDFPDVVYVDTDSDAIASDVESRFPTVSVHRRPDTLGTGDTPMTAVIHDFLNNHNFENVLQVHSTSPFLSVETLSLAYREFTALEDCDSVFGVTKVQARLWTSELAPINHDPQVLERTQDLQPVFLENSAFYFFQSTVLRETGQRIGTAPRAFSVKSLEAIDIDSEEDFSFAQTVAYGLQAQK